MNITLNSRKRILKKVNMIKVFYFVNTVLFRLILTFSKKNVVFQKGLRINKWPIININKNAQLILGENVILNSSNKSYHVNMFAPVKILCDKPNAVIKIGDFSRIHGSCIHAFEKIEIGNNCLIAANCQIIDSNGHATEKNMRLSSQGSTSPIKIGNNVWIGTGCIILPGVTIGDGSIVAAGSVVTKSIPENSIYGGNPAQFLRKIEE